MKEAPKSFHNIATYPDKQLWFESYYKEIEAFERLGGLKVVTRPHNQEVLKLLELMKYKKDNISSETKRKTRIVVRGDMEWTTVFEELYSPVAAHDTIRLFLSFVANFGWEIKQLDISNANINARREKMWFMELRIGHRMKDGQKYVWATIASVYGLKHAHILWYKIFKEVLMSNGLKLLNSEPCCFMDEEKLF